MQEAISSCKGICKKSYEELLRSGNFYLCRIGRWFIKYEFIKCEHIYEIKFMGKFFFNNKLILRFCARAISWSNCQWNEFLLPKEIFET